MTAVPTHEPPSLSLGMSLSSAKSAYPPAYPIWYDDEDEAEMLSVHATDDPRLRSHDALSYARRPSSTNTHSTIPLLHRHSSSSTTHSSTGHSTNSAEEDSDISGPTSSSNHNHHHRRSSYGTPLPPPAPTMTSDTPEATVTSRKRNRASLPAYFSLLTLGAPHAKSSLTMSPPRSSVDTARGRPSPTNPRLARPALDSTHAVAGASPCSAPLTSPNTEGYRGRRREPASPSRARPRSLSRSRSRSRSRSASRSPEWMSGKEDVRGRRRLDELDGWVTDREYGYGRGRSGLRDREDRLYTGARR